MFYDPHIHCLVTAGGLSGDRERWVTLGGDFFDESRWKELFLSRFTALFREAIRRGEFRGNNKSIEIKYPANTSGEFILKRFDTELAAGSGNVYLESVATRKEIEMKLGYIGKYVNRVAITNEQIVGFEGSNVTFYERTPSPGVEHNPIQLPADEFIRRFLLHVFDSNYHRYRPFGLLSSRGGGSKIIRKCLQLIEPDPYYKIVGDDVVLRMDKFDPNHYPEYMEAATKYDDREKRVVRNCPHCGEGHLVHRG